MTILKPGSGTGHPASGDCVTLSFIAWRRNGAIFSTSGLHGEPEAQCLVTAIPGITEALKLMVPGEKRRVWVPSNMAFAAHIAHHGPKAFHSDDPPPRVDLTVDVELIGILKAPLTPPDLLKPPPGATVLPSGVTFKVLTPGSGSVHPNAENQVLVNYTGWTADGELFESTEMSHHPTEVLIGTALAGWREILPQMVTGEKVRVWIPAALAYGEHPIQRMVPAGKLVYDLELLEIK